MTGGALNGPGSVGRGSRTHKNTLFRPGSQAMRGTRLIRLRLFVLQPRNPTPAPLRLPDRNRKAYSADMRPTGSQIHHVSRDDKRPVRKVTPPQ